MCISKEEAKVQSQHRTFGSMAGH